MTPKYYQKVGIATVKDPLATFWALNADNSNGAIAIEMKVGVLVSRWNRHIIS